jgi:phage terminase large subunit
VSTRKQRNPPGKVKPHRLLAAALRRSRAELVPPAFQHLWQKPRYHVLYGGRGAAKSWSIARVLLMLAAEQKLRILCCREIQSSIKESAYRLLLDQVQLLELDDQYDIGADSITGRNGSRFFFEGLKFNQNKIRSYEGINIVWVEEAQTVSEYSWLELIPTIRAPGGSRFYISFNPLTREDPVSKLFVESGRPDAIVRKVSWRDNPHLSIEAQTERAWLEKTDADSYQHVWEGFPRTISDALIFKGKYSVEEFQVSPNWSGPHHGMDFGFASDPSAAIRCYIDDETRTLYCDAEYWALHADLEAMPGALEFAIPGISHHTIFADCARPETISFLRRNGVPGIVAAEKWPNSIDDGVVFLRTFSKIVIAPQCKHLIDEAANYCFKTDRLTGAVLPQVLDRHNHLFDSLRYSLSPLIRNQPSSAYFSRSAMLVRGEPVEVSDEEGRPRRIFTVMATAGMRTGVGAVHFAHYPHFGVPLRVLGYSLVEIDQLVPQWLLRTFEQAQELRAEWNAVEATTAILTAEAELQEALGRLFMALVELHELDMSPLMAGQRPLYDVRRIEDKQLVALTLDERAAKIRDPVNAGHAVKFARSAYVQESVFRSTTANHLVNQVLGFRPGSRDSASQELVGAFVAGVGVAMTGHMVAPPLPELERSTVEVHGLTAPPDLPAPAPAPPAPAAAPSPPPPPRVPRDWRKPAPRSYLALHGTLPPDPSSRPGTIRIK